MNPNYKPKTQRSKIVAELSDALPLAPAKPARPDFREASNFPAAKRPKEPKWENLTLDELKNWLEEAKRHQATAEPFGVGAGGMSRKEASPSR
jgi:hypothetical protein